MERAEATMNRRQALRMLRSAAPYFVESCSDGKLLVTPQWPNEFNDTCDECGKPVGPGIRTRMRTAEAVQIILADAVRGRGKAR